MRNHFRNVNLLHFYFSNGFVFDQNELLNSKDEHKNENRIKIFTQEPELLL